MKVAKRNLDLYRSLYWANQGLLHAVRALKEADVSPQPASALVKDKLRRAQAMIEETRTLINRSLAEWIEPNE